MEPTSVPSFEKHAQNGVRREPVTDSIGGARRTLCASTMLYPSARVLYDPVAEVLLPRTAPRASNGCPITLLALNRAA